MTKLSYKINYAGITLVETTSYEEAQREYKEAKEKAPHHWEVELETVLTPYDPYDTPERRANAKAHREKVWAKRLEKELAHAPSYVNTSGVGAC